MYTYYYNTPFDKTKTSNCPIITKHKNYMKSSSQMNLKSQKTYCNETKKLAPWQYVRCFFPPVSGNTQQTLQQNTADYFTTPSPKKHAAWDIFVSRFQNLWFFG